METLTAQQILEKQLHAERAQFEKAIFFWKMLALSLALILGLAIFALCSK